MIVKTHTVTLGMLFAAINVYLLIGIIGGYGYMLLENSVPGSLGNLSLQSMAFPTRFFYFSFITLSTLRYGDIILMNPLVRSISKFLSILGPLYLTLLVAILVGRYLNEHRD
jgi:voltage-gated potassium channel